MHRAAGTPSGAAMCEDLSSCSPSAELDEGETEARNATESIQRSVIVIVARSVSSVVVEMLFPKRSRTQLMLAESIQFCSRRRASENRNTLSA